MPLEIMPAVTLASPALSAGSRRPPASNSMRTSTMGIEGLSTRYTLAPLGCVHCWIGIAASACAQHSSKAAGRKHILVVIDMRPSQWRRPGGGVRGLRFGSTGWGRNTPTVSWSSPKYLAATAFTCSAVTPRRRWISRSARIQRQALDPIAAELPGLVR